MSRNIRPFSGECDHVLRALPIFDMTVQYGCDKCGGIQDVAAEALNGADYETVMASVLAELSQIGGTIGPPVELPPSSFDADDAITNRLAEGGIAFIEYLDAWIDKGIADGTLELGKAARYREAIARRCAELGEVPHRQEHIAHLDLKAGDILAVIAPMDSRTVMEQVAEHTRRFLKYVGVDGVEVMVFPPGTELRVLEGAAIQVSDKVREYVDAKVAEGVMTQEQFRERLQREIRLQGRW